MAGDSKGDPLPELNYAKGEFHQAMHQITRPTKHEGTISWEIDDFLKIAELETEAKSLPMEFRFGESVYKFQLKLLFQTKDKPDDIGLYFINLGNAEVKVDYNLRAIDATGAEIGSYQCTASKIKSQGGWFFPKFLSKKELKKKAVGKSMNHTIKFTCDFTIFLDSVSKVFKGEPEVGPKRGSSLVEAMSALWKSGLLNDFTIACEGKEFKCHKVILASRSTYFESLFNSDLQEATENFVDIKDAGADTVGSFIEFVYTDQLSDESQFSTELLILAERFQFEALKLACEEAISKTINLVSML
jgi:hypothetical protein